MKTAISLPDSLFDGADRLAKQLGISRSRIFQEAIREFLKAHEQAAVTAALDTIYEEEQADVDPVLWQMQLASLSGADRTTA